MAIVHFSRYRTKARRSPNGPPTDAQLAALSEKMQNAFSLDFSRGVTKLKDSVSSAAMEKAFRSGNYKAVTETKEWRKLSDHLDDAVGRIGDAVQASGELAEAKLPRVVKENLDFDTRNPAITDYLETRTGALIENVTDAFQDNVAVATRMAFDGGGTAREVADDLREKLRDTIGLNTRQATALMNYQGDDKKEYAERLLDQRAMMIARTEISYANNQGQISVWQAAKDQGLLPNGKKEWITDGNPCPFICEDMDGVQVGLDDPFELPDGAQVDGPPAHPNCLCSMALDVGDGAGVPDPDKVEDNSDEGEPQAEDDDFEE